MDAELTVYERRIEQNALSFVERGLYRLEGGTAGAIGVHSTAEVRRTVLHSVKAIELSTVVIYSKLLC